MRFILALIAFPLISEASIVNNDMLYKISIVESDCDENAIGDEGLARGAFQLHRVAFDDAVRLMKTDKEFMAYASKLSSWRYEVVAHNYDMSMVIAEVLLRWYERRIAASGHTPCRNSLYMCYNMGYTGAKLHDFNCNNPRLPNKRKAILARAELILR